MSKFIGEPWRVVLTPATNGGDTINIKASNDELIAVVNSFMSREIDMDNARLIAACPRMFEALDSIANGNVTTSNGKRCHTWSFSELRERAAAALGSSDDKEKE